jgi:hypothetical protein
MEMPQPAQLSKSKKPDKKIEQKKSFAPRPFDPIEHGQVKPRGLLFLFCGVILPTIALLFETNFHFCAHNFFDPFPTASHVVLFGLIPLSNFLVWLGTRRDLSNHYAFMSLASGMAMGVSCLYSLMFLPLTPISCFFALALGFGLLGLAPLLSVPCNLIAGKTVCHLAERKGTYFNAHQFEHVGHMIILVMVIAIELPSTLTRINIAKAADANVIESSSGINWLRRYGSQEVLLRSCYERSGKATDILGSLYESAHHTTLDQNRRVFFKVTGKPYNSVPIPKAARATILHTGVVSDPADLNAGVDDEFDIDTDIAGEAVSGVARGLAISQSEITGKVDSRAALATLTWSFDFSNDSKFNREARAKILLPPHAVTTKATLTINNVERDATIMVRSTARARYKKAVMEHKDPLLVSTCGSDQILVQCYPVKPGETVKVKLQIAAPMTMAQNKQATLMLPAFLERNFQVDLPIKVNIKSNELLTAGALKSTAEAVPPANEVTTDLVKPDETEPSYILTGDMQNSQLADFGIVISAPRNTNKTITSYTGNELPGQYKITRFLRPASYNKVKSLIILVDGSASMQSSFVPIAEALKQLPSNLYAQVKVVGDQTYELYPGLAEGGSGDLLKAADTLKAMKAEGGQDDSAALTDALPLAAMTQNMSVLWIHAAQPLTTGAARVKKCLKMTDRPLLFDMQVLAGPNELLNGVNSQKTLVRVERTGDLKTDLISFFKACSFNGKTLEESAPEYAFTQNATENNIDTGALPVDKRLAQIWANEKIAQDLEDPAMKGSPEPGILAEAFQIISPVSSAIVTEPSKKGLTNTRRKPKFSFKALNPMNGMRALRRKVSSQMNVDREIKSVEAQLNSLGAASSTSPVLQGATNGVVSPSSSTSQPEAKKAEVSDIRGPYIKRFKNADEFEAKEDLGIRGPYYKQFGGADGGAVGDKEVQVKNFRLDALPNHMNAAAPTPSIAGNENAKDKNQETEETAGPGTDAEADANMVDANGNPVDADGKPVPEADTWMLLSILALLFAGTWFNNKKRKAQRI